MSKIEKYSIAEWVKKIPSLTYDCARICKPCGRIFKQIADGFVYLVPVSKGMGYTCDIHRAPICSDCIKDFSQKYNIELNEE